MGALLGYYSKCISFSKVKELGRISVHQISTTFFRSLWFLPFLSSFLLLFLLLPSESATADPTSTHLTVSNVMKHRKKPQQFQDDNLLTIDSDPSPFDTSSLYSAPSLLSLHSTIEGGSSKHEEEKSVVRDYWKLLECSDEYLTSLSLSIMVMLQLLRRRLMGESAWEHTTGTSEQGGTTCCWPLCWLYSSWERYMCGYGWMGERGSLCVTSILCSYPAGKHSCGRLVALRLVSVFTPQSLPSFFEL